MANHLKKAQELLAEAEKKQNMVTEGGGGGCCGRAPKVKIEEVCEIYIKAANSFKMAKDWGAAGRAFTEVATLELDNNRQHESQSHFAEAAKCYKKMSAKDCANCLEKCIEISTDMGRTRVAAKHHQTLAELYEENDEIKDFAKSAHHYGLAKDLFTGDQSKSGATKCELQMAKLSALSGDYAKAADIYETKGENALESNLLKYTVSDMYLRAGLCRLYLFTSGGNPEEVAAKMEETVGKYEYSNPAFESSREATLLKCLSKAVSEGDIDAFNEAIRSHESVSRLDSWYHDIIKSIRKYLIGSDLR